MLNQDGITSKKFGAPVQILCNTQLQHSVGIVCNDTGAVAGSNGKKILKAGTPMTGDLDARLTPFTKSATNVQGYLLHDVEFATGKTTANATLLLFGFVNFNRLDTATQALITAAVKTQTPLVKIYKA